MEIEQCMPGEVNVCVATIDGLRTRLAKQGHRQAKGKKRIWYFKEGVEVVIMGRIRTLGLLHTYFPVLYSFYVLIIIGGGGGRSGLTIFLSLLGRWRGVSLWSH